MGLMTGKHGLIGEGKVARWPRLPSVAAARFCQQHGLALHVLPGYAKSLALGTF